MDFDVPIRTPSRRSRTERLAGMPSSPLIPSEHSFEHPPGVPPSDPRDFLRHELRCSMDGKTRRTSVQRDAGFGGDVLEKLGQEAARVSDGRKLQGLFQLAQSPGFERRAA